MSTEFSDGTAIPHADGWDDLLTKLNTFLTTDSDLVSAGQEWSILKDSSVTGNREVYLKGPGLSLSDEIHVNIKVISDLGTGAFNWEVRASTGFDTILSFDDQPGVSPDQYLPLANTGVTIQYWFFASGRRFMVVGKIAAVYLSCYCGFFLPYALPSEYPYPMLIACGGESASAPYSAGTEEVTGFFNPSSIEINGQSFASNSFRLVNGIWDRAVNKQFTDSGDSNRSGRIWPNGINGLFDPDIGGDFPDDGSDSYNMGRNIDDSYTLLPFILYVTRDSDILGELDGVFWVSGDENIPENTLTINSDTYIVHQNANQATIADFAAFKVE